MTISILAPERVVRFMNGCFPLSNQIKRSMATTVLIHKIYFTALN